MSRKDFEMDKLTKKEKDKIAKQSLHPERGSTWIGIRPSVFKSAKHDIKKQRRESKNVFED